MKYIQIASQSVIDNAKSGLYEHNARVYDQVVQALHNCNDICIVSGTGTGKSFITFALVNGPFQNGERVLYISPKESIAINLRKYDAFFDVRDRIDFANNMWFNSSGKVDNAFENYDIIILDESHHIGADLTGTHLRDLLNRIKSNPNKAFIGLTATPVRDCDGMDTSRFFSETVYGMSTIDCIEQGLMPQVEYLICKPDKALTDDERDLYREKLSIDGSHALLQKIIHNNPRDRWLCYFSDISEMRSTEPQIQALFPNHRLICVSSDTDGSQSEIDRIKDDERVVILSVDMLLEGMHLPNMEGVLLFRNVQSLNVFQQIFGRVTSIGAKTSPLFIDCTSTASRLFRRMISPEMESGIQQTQTGQKTLRPILRVSLQNQEYYDISRLLLVIEEQQKGITVLGVTYPTMKAACEALGLNSNSVAAYRCKNNLTAEEAILELLEKERRFKQVIFDGKTYPTLKAACEAAGVNYNSLQRKKKAFASYQAAFDDAVSKLGRSIYAVTVHGNEYPSIQQACQVFGVDSRYIVKYRLRHGCDVETAIDHYLALKPTVFQFEGLEYSSVKACCEALGIDYMAVMKHKNRSGKSVEDALSYIIARDSQFVIVHGEKYKSINEIAVALNLEAPSLHNWIKTGMTPEEAVDKLLANRKARSFEYEGTTFVSFAEACRNYGLSPNCVRASARYHGWTKEQAFAYLVSKNTA